MPSPGTTVRGRETPAPKTAPTKTDTAFVTGISERGPEDPVLITSMERFVQKLGGLTASSAMLYHAVDAKFRIGIARVYVRRVLGVAAAQATLDLADSAPATTLTITAKEKGVYFNDVTIQVTNGEAGASTRRLIVFKTGVEVERTEDFDLAAMSEKTVEWSEFSDWIDIVDGPGTALPAVVAATALVGGDDDIDGIAEAQWTAAVDDFDYDLGPGQVLAPGRSTTAAHGVLLDHAAARNRRALLDTADTTSEATMKASAAALRNHVNARYGMLLGNWVEVPGLIPNTTRFIPPSAVAAALIARSDNLGGSPNDPAAGVNGRTIIGLDVRKKYTDGVLTDLNDEGVMMFKTKYGRGDVRLYGYRTLVDPAVNSNWWQFSNSRLFMALVAKGDIIAERYVFAKIDGQRIKIGKYQGELQAMLYPYWIDGSLYGATPTEAFNVNVGEDVNPVEDLAAGKLRAVMAVKMSPFAEEVILEIVKTHLTEEV